MTHTTQTFVDTLRLAIAADEPIAPALARVVVDAWDAAVRDRTSLDEGFGYSPGWSRQTAVQSRDEAIAAAAAGLPPGSERAIAQLLHDRLAAYWPRRYPRDVAAGCAVDPADRDKFAIINNNGGNVPSIAQLRLKLKKAGKAVAKLD